MAASEPIKFNTWSHYYPDDINRRMRRSSSLDDGDGPRCRPGSLLSRWRELDSNYRSPVRWVPFRDRRLLPICRFRFPKGLTYRGPIVRIQFPPGELRTIGSSAAEHGVFVAVPPSSPAHPLRGASGSPVPFARGSATVVILSREFSTALPLRSPLHQLIGMHPRRW